jgi:hypothetical protein
MTSLPVDCKELSKLGQGILNCLHDIFTDVILCLRINRVVDRLRFYLYDIESLSKHFSFMIEWSACALLSYR